MRFVVSVLALLLAVPAHAATLRGIVRDAATGQPLPGAVVLLDGQRFATTDSLGRYTLEGLPGGREIITVRLLGYAGHALEALVPEEGDLEIDVALHAEPIPMKPIQVRAPLSIRGIDPGMDRPAFHRGSSMAQVRSHPLLSEPDVFQVLAGGEVVVAPESPTGVHIRGGSADQTAFLLDGIPVFSPYHAAGVFSAWNPDAISRLDVVSAGPGAGRPHTLSGTVEAITRDPARAVGVQATTSTTQARVSVHGPLGRAGAGFLLSARSDYPDALAPDENSYVKGATDDRLVKIVIPAFQGHVRLLGYENGNELTASAAVEIDEAPPGPRNAFYWRSRSVGAEWSHSARVGETGAAARDDATIRVWQAEGRAGSTWSGETALLSMEAKRRDHGFLASFQVARGTAVGLRLEDSRTDYRVQGDSATAPSVDLTARTPVIDLFASHNASLGSGFRTATGATLSWSTGEYRLSPGLTVQWNRAPVTVSAGCSRQHQFAQSLRNAESVVGRIFPAELYIGAAAPGVPVARKDEGAIGIDIEPAARVRLRGEAWIRKSDGLLLVAPRTGEPFLTTEYTIGSGNSRGVSVEAAMSTRRLGFTAVYSLQRVRLESGDARWAPEHSAAHRVDAGLILLPIPSTSLRIGAVGVLGRRTTNIPGEFEWEACNVADQGCEFGGSPHYGSEPLGATALPGYFRLDLGVRKTWEFTLAGRMASLAVFGTVTNLLNRKNVLTYSRDTSNGELSEISMRPLTPLVIGIDATF